MKYRNPPEVLIQQELPLFRGWTEEVEGPQTQNDGGNRRHQVDDVRHHPTQPTRRQENNEDAEQQGHRYGDDETDDRQLDGAVEHSPDAGDRLVPLIDLPFRCEKEAPSLGRDRFYGGNAQEDRNPSEHEKGRERSHRDASIENPVAPVRGGRGVEVSTGLRRRGYHGGTLAIARSREMMLAQLTFKPMLNAG